MKLVEDSKPLAAVRADDYDGALLVGGQGPMDTFFDERVHELVASFYEAGKVTAVICPATCVLLKAARRWAPARRRQDMDRLRQLRGALRGRLRQKVQPFWIEDEAGSRHRRRRLRALGMFVDPDGNSIGLLHFKNPETRADRCLYLEGGRAVASGDRLTGRARPGRARAAA